MRAHVHIHKYIRGVRNGHKHIKYHGKYTCTFVNLYTYICIHTYIQVQIYNVHVHADSPPLQLLWLMAETLSITNIARLINVPQFSTTSLVQSRIGNTPVYTYTLAHTHTHKRMYMRIHTYIYVFPISEMSSERHPQKNCSTSTIIDMLSMRTSGTPRRGNWRSGLQLPLCFMRASS